MSFCRPLHYYLITPYRHAIEINVKHFHLRARVTPTADIIYVSCIYTGLIPYVRSITFHKCTWRSECIFSKAKMPRQPVSQLWYLIKVSSSSYMPHTVWAVFRLTEEFLLQIYFMLHFIYWLILKIDLLKSKNLLK